MRDPSVVSTESAFSSAVTLPPPRVYPATENPAVVPETVEASLQMGGILLSAVGVSTDEITRVMNDFRKDNYARLEALAEPKPTSGEAADGNRR